MIQRFYQLYRRYANRHRRLCVKVAPLTDAEGSVVAEIERFGIRGNRLIVRGWTVADHVELNGAGGSVDVVPWIDSPGTPDKRGFEVNQPYFAGLVTLTLNSDTTSAEFKLPHIPVVSRYRAETAIMLRFLRDGLRALPSVFRWFTKHDAGARARVKSLLGLDADDEVLGRLNGDVLFGFSSETTSNPEASCGITIVLPIYDAFDLLERVLDRVVRNTDLPWKLVLIEDCSRDARVLPFVREWVAKQNSEQPDRVLLIENARNEGFVASVNRALAACEKRDDHVVLLNSDAFVPPCWASRLLAPILRDDRIASVTPLSNDAEIFSVPVICTRTELNEEEVEYIDGIARSFHPEEACVDAPTGVGFCMAMNRRYLQEVAYLDMTFGRGYGEEVDWCQRARLAGGRNVCAGDLFVGHCGGTSFGSAEKLKLVSANNAIISRRYPAYDNEVQSFVADDPLLTPRLALAVAWAAGRSSGPIPIYLAHSLGGGAESWLKGLLHEITANAGVGIVLRVGGQDRWILEVHSEAGVSRGATDSFELVKRLLEPVSERRVVYSCGVGDRDPIDLPDRLIELARGKSDRVEVLFHDFFPVSPSYCLLDSDGEYRGVPDLSSSDAAHRSKRLDGSAINLPEWRAGWERIVTRADRLLAFSDFSAALIAEAYPDARNRIVVVPHSLPRPVRPVAVAHGGKFAIGILGNIGVQKGASVVVRLSRLVRARRDVSLVLIGNLDPAFVADRALHIHGQYAVDDIPALAERYQIACWLIPSIWPETFSFATHEALATGLPVFCFNLGAQADAVRKAPNGHVLPFAPHERSAEQVLAHITSILVAEGVVSPPEAVQK